MVREVWTRGWYANTRSSGYLLYAGLWLRGYALASAKAYALHECASKLAEARWELTPCAWQLGIILLTRFWLVVPWIATCKVAFVLPRAR